ncbi:MAG: TonB-dependent receptor [Balneolaceae bacterium]|nr:MAG: TonB-dependent receptor [Balneolaceae bacterium]
MSKIVILILGALLFAPAASANQTEAAADTLKLDQIVITASKIPLSERETTKPVIIITRAEIERNSGRDLSQILNQQSGIRVNDAYGAPSNSRILYLQGAAAQNTLILVDGLPISDPSGVGGLFDLRLLPTNNLERIEVIKGSQSTLYGTDAIAGVVNLITRTGGDAPFQAAGRLSYGTYNTFNSTLGVNGTAGNRIRYTLNYNRESSDGFSAARNPGGLDPFGNDGYELHSFFGRTDILISDNFSISPFLNFSLNEGDYDAGSFADADNFYTLELVNPGIQARYSGNSFRFNAGYNYSRTSRSFDSQFGFDEFEGRFHNADIFSNYSITDNLKLLAGFNFQQFSIPASQDLPERDATITSPYATFYFRDLGGFSAELGYRLNNHTEYGNNSTFSFAPAYMVNDQLKLYGSVSTGFKAPTLDELFGPFGANPDLDPQKSLYYNAGFELYLLDQSLKLTAQYFNREIDDLIVFSAMGYLNRDRQNDYGVELTADWLINSRVTAGAWYNFLDGEITNFFEDGTEAVVSNLIRRPKHSVGMNLGVSVTDRLFIRADGEYNGERQDLFFNPANNFAQEDVTLDAYTLINLYAEYAMMNRSFTLFGDIKNLLNTDFTEVYGFNTTGFAVKAGVRFSI